MTGGLWIHNNFKVSCTMQYPETLYKNEHHLFIKGGQLVIVGKQLSHKIWKSKSNNTYFFSKIANPTDT